MKLQSGRDGDQYQLNGSSNKSGTMLYDLHQLCWVSAIVSIIHGNFRHK